MFVTVRYGDGKQEVFNPNCRTVNFLKCIRDRCLHCEGTDEIELSDENGNIKFLRDALNSYASDLLGEREMLVLLRVDQSENRYTPMLSDQDAITEDFLAHLVVKDELDSRPASRRGRSSKTPKSQEKEVNNKQVTNIKERKKIVSSAKSDRVPRARSRQGRI